VIDETVPAEMEARKGTHKSRVKKTPKASPSKNQIFNQIRATPPRHALELARKGKRVLPLPPSCSARQIGARKRKVQGSLPVQCHSSEWCGEPSHHSSNG
jgi:hypothetical protein